jgi:hypothetical protein
MSLLPSRERPREAARDPTAVPQATPVGAADMRSSPLEATHEGVTHSREPTVEEIAASATAEAQIVRADRNRVRARAWAGQFERIFVEPNEALAIRLTLAKQDTSQPVRIEADNGGSLNRRLGPLVLNPGAQGGPLEFQYAVGMHRGRYTLLVTQGSREELMEFWVGDPMPLGQAGPPRAFSGDNT